MCKLTAVVPKLDRSTHVRERDRQIVHLLKDIYHTITSQTRLSVSRHLYKVQFLWTDWIQDIGGQCDNYPLVLIIVCLILISADSSKDFRSLKAHLICCILGVMPLSVSWALPVWLHILSGTTGNQMTTCIALLTSPFVSAVGSNKQNLSLQWELTTKIFNILTFVACSDRQL